MQYKLSYSSPYEDWGPAITRVEVNSEGEMWVTNDEYWTRVNFCPFTGTPAPKQMKVEDMEIRTSEGVKHYKQYKD